MSGFKQIKMLDMYAKGELLASNAEAKANTLLLEKLNQSIKREIEEIKLP